MTIPSTDEYAEYTCPKCGRMVTAYSCGMCTPVQYPCGCAVWWDSPEKAPYLIHCEKHKQLRPM